MTPVVGRAVTFTATTGTVQFAACGAATCTVQTECAGHCVDAGDCRRPRARLCCRPRESMATATASFTAIVPGENGDRGAAGGVCCGRSDRRVDAAAQRRGQCRLRRRGCALTGRRSPGAMAASPGQSQVECCGSGSTTRDGGAACGGRAGSLFGLCVDERLRRLSRRRVWIRRSCAWRR